MEDLRCRKIIRSTLAGFSGRIDRPRVSSSRKGRSAVSQLQQNMSGCNSTARARAVVPERGIPPSNISNSVIGSDVLGAFLADSRSPSSLSDTNDDRGWRRHVVVKRSERKCYAGVSEAGGLASSSDQS